MAVRVEVGRRHIHRQGHVTARTQAGSGDRLDGVGQHRLGGRKRRGQAALVGGQGTGCVFPPGKGDGSLIYPEHH